MDKREFAQLAEEMGNIALMATKALAAELNTGGEKIDTRTAKDLSGIIKDMTALLRDIGGGDREVKVIFEGGSEDAAD